MPTIQQLVRREERVKSKTSAPALNGISPEEGGLHSSLYNHSQET